jgi:hypothetical protein
MKMAAFWVVAAASTSEALVNFYQTTRCYNPEDSHLHPHLCSSLNVRGQYKTTGKITVLYILIFVYFFIAYETKHSELNGNMHSQFNLILISS